MSRTILRTAALSATALVILAEPLPLLSFAGFVQHAEARLAQPWTAASGADVARRITRRSIRRTTVFVATLQPACVRTTPSSAPSSGPAARRDVSTTTTDTW